MSPLRIPVPLGQSLGIGDGKAASFRFIVSVYVVSVPCFLNYAMRFVSQNRVFSWRDTIISVLKQANSLRLGFPILY